MIIKVFIKNISVGIRVSCKRWYCRKNRYFFAFVPSRHRSYSYSIEKNITDHLHVFLLFVHYFYIKVCYLIEFVWKVFVRKFPFSEYRRQSLSLKHRKKRLLIRINHVISKCITRPQCFQLFIYLHEKLPFITCVLTRVFI